MLAMPVMARPGAFISIIPTHVLVEQPRAGKDYDDVRGDDQDQEFGVGHDQPRAWQ